MTSNSEDIKPVALNIVKLCLGEGSEINRKNS